MCPDAMGRAMTHEKINAALIAAKSIIKNVMKYVGNHDGDCIISFWIVLYCCNTAIRVVNAIPPRNPATKMIC